MQYCYVELYINPAKLAPGVKNGPTPGLISSHRLKMGKTLKNLLLPNYMAQRYHILYVAMYSDPLYKFCLPCCWGPYRPCPGGIVFHRHIVEIHDNIFSETAKPKACIFDMQQCHVELYINSANHVSGVKYGPTLGVIIGP